MTNLAFFISAFCSIGTLICIYRVSMRNNEQNNTKMPTTPLFILKFLLAKEISKCRTFWQLQNCIMYRDRIIDNYIGDEELTPTLNFLANEIQKKEVELLLNDTTIEA